jgi:hypothetical protein
MALYQLHGLCCLMIGLSVNGVLESMSKEVSSTSYKISLEQLPEMT